MEARHTFDYAVKVWLTTIVFAPVLLVFITGFVNTVHWAAIISALPLLMVMIFIGLFFSLPALVLFILVYSWLRQVVLPVVVKKIILSLSGILFVFISFMFLDSDMMKQRSFTSKVLPEIYALSLVASTCMFKMWQAEPAA